MRLKKFVKLYIAIPFSLLFLTLLINIIIDPYSMTSYNLLKIPNKFARDDRGEKVTKLYNSPRYDNMIFGSSRVYVTNPLMISKYLGGKTYNCGVGTALIEDQLGFLLFLQKIGKLPKNAIFGLDFYSFNPNVETNKYFIKNSELNFMKKDSSVSIYFEKFLSIDALRASFKTFYNFIVNSKDIPRFDDNGGAYGVSKNFSYQLKDFKKTTFNPLFIANDKHKIKTVNYKDISQDRLGYVKKIVDICKKEDMNCTFFTTPLNGQMLAEFTSDKVQKKTLEKFKKELAKITPYYDFLYHNKIIDNSSYFVDTMHFRPEAGNLLFARLFHDKNISLPENFGVYISKDLKR